MEKFDELSSSEILAKMVKTIPDRTLRNDLSILQTKKLINRKGKGRAIVWLILKKSTKSGKNPAEIRQ